jgi:dipeptidyl-peptidase-4
MKINKILIVICSCAVNILIAQKQQLSLKDAVLNQYRTFGPERNFEVKWIPGTSTYSFLKKGYDKLFVADSKSGKEIEVLNLTDFNKITGLTLTSFYGVEWISSNRLIVPFEASYVVYDLEEQQVVSRLKYDEHAENLLLYKQDRIAYTIENNIEIVNANGDVVRVTDNRDKNIVSGQSIARNEFGIKKGLFWSNTGSILAFYQKDESNVSDYPLLDITKTPGELVSIKYPMAGLGSEKPKVGLYHLKSGNSIFISPRGAADNYLTNFSFTPDDKFVLIAEVNRDQNHMWLNLYSAQDGQFIRTLVEESNSKWVEPEHPAFFPSNKSTNFIWVSERDGFNNLYYYNLSGKLIKQLTTNQFVTKEIVSSANDIVYFYATGENPMNTMLYRVDLNGKQSLITKVEGDHECAVSQDGKWIYDFYTSNSDFGTSQLLDFNGKLQRVVKKSVNGLASFQIGTCELGRLKANDGSILYTRMIKPSNFDPSKKYPVLVYVYGGPHAQMVTNSWLGGANLWMFWMAEQGYLVYTVDNRGSGERGFAFESQIHRQLGTVEMEDQLSGVEYLKSLPYVDKNRLAVHGWSFGGFMTTSLMLRNPGVFKVGVAGGPVTDWKYYEVMYGERYMDRPEENETGYQQACLMNHAQNLTGDLLLIHGTVDDVVVMQHNYALVKKFVEIGKQMDFFPYPMHKHNVSGKDRVHLIEKILTYVIEHNQ